MKNSANAAYSFSSELQLTPESRWPLSLPQSTLKEVLARPVRSFSECHSRSVHKGGEQSTSIVIVSFNNLVFNRLCLESVLASTSDSGIEIIVVDNGSSDGTVDYLLKLAGQNPPIKLILNRRNLGFAAACNLGLSKAIGEVLVVLNNDTIVPAQWLEKLTEKLSDPDIGMVGPATNRCGNEAQIDTGYESYGEFLDFAAARSRSHAGQLQEIPTLIMFCVALRREVYKKIGKFDERFEIGLFEDEDYCIRLRKAGFRLVCAEDVFIHHFGQASIGKLAVSGKYGELFHRNRKKFEHKWGCKWTPHKQRPNPEYQELVGEIQDIIESTLPHDASVLVVSRGDEDLLTLAGRRALHFPLSSDGLYAGHHPENSSDAICHLEQLRDDGAQFLIIPQTMFWWLEFYPEFAHHLAHEYRCVEHDDLCLIYQLASLPSTPFETSLSASIHSMETGRLTRRLVTVIFPVQGSIQVVSELLESLLKFGHHPHRLLLIDNAIQDRQVSALLEQTVRQKEHVALAITAKRLSDVSAVNIGLRLAPGDVVLFSGSLGLTRDWLEKLCAHVQSTNNVATASPLPKKTKNQCLFITRQSLRRTGLLDQESFASLPEALANFRSKAAGNGFLQLDGFETDLDGEPAYDHSASEGRSNQEVQTAGPVRFQRYDIDSQRAAGLLTIIHAGSGGAHFATEDILPALSREFRCLLLITALSSWSLFTVLGGRRQLIRQYRFSESWRMDSPFGSERELVLQDLCSQFAVDLVHVNHLLCSGPGLISTLKKLNLPVVASFHDFYTLCPTAHLIDNEGNFCGGTCSSGSGKCQINKKLIRSPVPKIKHEFVHQHRASLDRALTQCDAFTAPSHSARNRLLLQSTGSIRPENFHVFEHGIDAVRQDLAARPATGLPIKVICLGNLNQAKGASLIWELMQLNAVDGHRLEFHFLGSQPTAFRTGTLGALYHGPYERGDYMKRLASIEPSFSLIASKCEETFSYTLSESWAAGLPVFASNRGALQERIEKHGGGWLFDPDNAEGFYAGMVDVLNSPEAWIREVNAIRRIELRSISQKADNMTQLFNHCLGRRKLASGWSN